MRPGKAKQLRVADNIVKVTETPRMIQHAMFV